MIIMMFSFFALVLTVDVFGLEGIAGSAVSAIKTISFTLLFFFILFWLAGSLWIGDYKNKY